ncbi:MAG: glycosyltransferase family 2 protein [Candidatus Levybacteria bacterium]|nr:glycosyltransferase family 2 protein [Candidatus Levybacteria bacterium]
MNSYVSIIIVNLNGKVNLEICLNSLFKITYSPFEIIVVDNGSTDGSIDFLKKKFPSVKIVETNKNLGFAQGNNVGYRKSKGEYILLLNNDCIVTKNFLDKLVSCLKKNSTVGIIQPTIFFYRPGTSLHKKINSVGSFFLKSGFLYHQDYGKNFVRQKYLKPYEVFSAYGACLLVKREVVEKVGLFDPDFFLYFEETDLCHRVWLAGYSVMVDPRVYVFHKGAQTSKKLPAAFVQFHSFKNKLYSYLKNLDFYHLIIMFVPHLFISEVGSLAYLFLGKPDYTLAIQKAIYWNVKNYKTILKERKKIQKNIRRVKDLSFIPKLTRSVRLDYYYYLSKGELEKYEGER